MEKTFEILDTPNNAGKLIVATSYVNPLGDLPVIAEKLAKENYNGKVLFDLVLCNGFASNRFIEIDANWKTIVEQAVTLKMAVVPAFKTTVISAEEVSDETLKVLYNFFMENPTYVDNSSLPEVQKHILRNGLMLKRVALKKL